MPSQGFGYPEQDRCMDPMSNLGKNPCGGMDNHSFRGKGWPSPLRASDFASVAVMIAPASAASDIPWLLQTMILIVPGDSL